ncbi:hypothetical protein GGX14DRAFT_576380 [Mycena pura]|uniref:Uncharacterized protein n=1 Tax=Mycena pura TaxID=153505 RepID=A0AAD6Y1B2_9AGAR|nr:hypothetical protein GGX14DRAFT_576380 [Mycena pura]
MEEFQAFGFWDREDDSDTADSLSVDLSRYADTGPHSFDEWRAEWGNPVWRVGWPRDTRVAAAALWVLWFFESKDTLAAEPEALRQHIMALLLPFVCAPFRYASALAPPHHYSVPLLPGVLAGAGTGAGGAITVPTFHGPYPIYPHGAPGAGRGGARALGRLLCAPPARLLFFARMQSRMGVPPHLPRDRADAEARWRTAGNAGPMSVGPTQADIHENNVRPVVRFEPQLPAAFAPASASASVPAGFLSSDHYRDGLNTCRLTLVAGARMSSVLPQPIIRFFVVFRRRARYLRAALNVFQSAAGCSGALLPPLSRRGALNTWLPLQHIALQVLCANSVLPLLAAGQGTLLLNLETAGDKVERVDVPRGRTRLVERARHRDGGTNAARISKTPDLCTIVPALVAGAVAYSALERRGGWADNWED